MARKTKAAIVAVEPQETQELEAGFLMPFADAEPEETDTRPRSVVPAGYKKHYQRKAQAEGRTSKAAKRCNGDWLAQELEGECVRGGKFDFYRFVAILEANGVDGLARWPNRNNGWEGRFRMSGAIVLRGIVGKSAVFRTPDSETNLVELVDQGDTLAAAFLSKWAN
jgi:hypothetical protein